MSPMIDRISALPDSLICHILLFLPTEEAVATSVLSKRWRSLWLWVTRLTFDDRRYSQNKDTYSRFIHMVYTAMLLRGGEQSIKSFCLLCLSSLCDPVVVTTWLMAANQRNVEIIRLYLPKTVNLSFSVFSSTTLVVLKLFRFSVKPPSSISFPSLKVLYLTSLSFQVHSHIAEILSACPILEVLLMKSLIFINPSAVGESKHFHLPKLVKADISTSYSGLPLKPFYNVQFLSADLGMTMELPTHNLVNLTYLELHFMGNYWAWLIKLLPYCPNLQSLAIDKIQGSSLFTSSDDTNWVQPQSVPKCILLQLKRFRVKNYEEMESELQFTKYILHNARVLREVAIFCSGSSNPQDKFQMIQKLTLCQRGSDLCQLRFE